MRGQCLLPAPGWIERINMFEWTCICCEKEIPYDPNGAGDDSRGILPNLDGGTIDFHFGYGSKFDMLPLHMYERDIRIQGSICDNCFEKKQHLTRQIEVVTDKSFKDVNKK